MLQPARNKLAGKPVEKLRMAWRIGTQPKVAGRAHQPFAEVVHPDPVHPHPRGQRVLRIDDRAGQFEPAATVSEGYPIGPGKHFEKLPRHGFALVRRIAAAKDPGLDRCPAINNHNGMRRRFGRL